MRCVYPQHRQTCATLYGDICQKAGLFHYGTQSNTILSSLISHLPQIHNLCAPTPSSANSVKHSQHPTCLKLPTLPPTPSLHYVVFTYNPCSIWPLSPYTSMLPMGQTTLEPSTPIPVPAVTKDEISQSLGTQFYRERCSFGAVRGCQPITLLLLHYSGINITQALPPPSSQNHHSYSTSNQTPC
jgi:hypothetical protein